MGGKQGGGLPAYAGWRPKDSFLVDDEGGHDC